MKEEKLLPLSKRRIIIQKKEEEMTGYDVFLIIATLICFGVHIYSRKVINQIKQQQQNRKK